MELKQAIKERRSIRKYIKRHISDTDMNDILEMATFAPSGVNLQPWYFVVCRSDEAKQKLNKAMETGKTGFEQFLSDRFPNNPEIVTDTLHFIDNFGGADICVLAFLKDKEYAEELSAIQSVAAAMQNMALTAYEKGIGSCWTTAPLHAEKAISEQFAPDKGRLISAMIFGYYEKHPKAPSRKQGRIEII